jgi:dolichol-phosphate mannosyltransferase
VPETIVIIPTYNEVEGLEAIIGRLRQTLPDIDLLIVDDNSPDGTGELADRLAAGDHGIRVMHRAGKDGLGKAYLAGFEDSLERGYERLVEMDADGSHDPAELPAMLALAEEADLVIGSRWVPGGAIRNWPWYRQAISRAGNNYAGWALRSNIKDITAGYRVFTADALRSVDLHEVNSQGYCFQIEMAWRLEKAGKRIEEHPITFVERATGHSKMHLGIVAEALLRVTLWGLKDRFAPRQEAAKV